jgi:antitoxin component YwqK of YwqJK toxin-antitoxin module
MKQKTIIFSTIVLLLTACSNDDSSNAVLSQRYIHKYGFDVSEAEWDARDQDGQIITFLKSGIKVTHTFENGILHGLTTYTYPHSSIVEKSMVYNQGTLQKETVNDPSGVPISEDVYELDDRRISTLWDYKGFPLSVEEYQGEILTEAKYFNPEHDLEGQVEAGFGEKYLRDRQGLLLSRELIENGIAVTKTNFHSNGQIHSISHYHNQQLHGIQKKFTTMGLPLMDLSWNHGILDGMKVSYRNGKKVAQIPYVNGERQGIEAHFDENGFLTAEIEWKGDKKHGPSRFYHGNAEEKEWFYNGVAVSQEKFETLQTRNEIVAELKLGE